MAVRLRNRISVPLALVAVELAVAVALVLAAAWSDRQGRQAGPESPVASYAAAVAMGDLVGALAQLAPELREQAEPFVAWQLGNRYTILESAVRAQSLLDRLLRKPASSPRVAVSLEVRNEDGAVWRTTEEVPVGYLDGRWYLMKPMLEP